MTNRSARKARRGQKRERIKRQARRSTAGSAYRRIGNSGELVACYMNRTWRTDGQASIHVLRRVPGGGHAMGAYLVDLWCAGLKDAWGRLDITYDEFRESILDRMPAEVGLTRVDLDVARRVVAGGIRFAEQNGFRLPPRYQRWVRLLGDIGDVAEADLSDFGIDGGLRYVGNMKDLQRRLVGCSAEEFLARKDVHFVIGDDDFTLLDDSTVAVEQVADQIGQRALGAVRQWCFANGIPPNPRLREAWDIVLESIMQIDELPEDDGAEETDYTPATDAMERLVALEGPSAAAELTDAVEQIRRFMAQFDGPDELFDSLGLDFAEDEE